MLTTPVRLQNKTVGELRSIAREDAKKFLESVSENAQYPLDVVAIARKAGIEVFSAQLGDDTYGMIESGPSGSTIYVDKDSIPERQRFTIAHELGHYVSYNEEAFEVTRVDKRSDQGIGTASEIYANEFAGELLMPERQVRTFATWKYSTFEMALEFGVSPTAVGYRRRILGI